MSTRYLPKKSRKAISPVIATVILVAVAVVIAAAMAGFAGSLFGSYSNGPQIKIQSMSLYTDGSGKVSLSNSGNAADTVQSVSVNLAGTVYNQTITQAIPANSNPVEVDFASVENGGTAPNIDAGQQVTAQVSLNSGTVLTQSLVVSPKP